MYIQGMDTSHISVFEINLENNWFCEYKVNEDTVIGINGNIFQKILSMWTSNHSIKLRLDDKNSDKINISFETIDDKKNEFNKYYELPLADLDCEVLNIPESEYTLDIEMNSKSFKKIVDELSTMGDTVTFNCDETEMNVLTKSLEGNMNVKIPFDHVELYSIEEGSTISSSFTLKYIKLISVFSKITNNTKIHITNDMPLLINYTLSEQSYIKFFLAPQCDN
jgi:proliferating cell nuclear antigen